MLSSAIVDLCHSIKNNQYHLDYDQTISSVMDLGNLYVLSEEANPDERSIIEITLANIKKNISAERVRAIWGELNFSQSSNFRDQEACSAIFDKLKFKMITEEFYFSKLSNESIINFGKNSTYYQHAMVALIRKHLLENKVWDPFSSTKTRIEGDFSFLHLLKHIASFPIDALYHLGEGNIDVARLILRDLESSSAYFQLSSRFAEKWSDLRIEISNQWGAYIDHCPLTSELREIVTKELNGRLAQLGEFESIQMPIEGNPSVNLDHFMPMMAFNLSSFMSAFTQAREMISNAAPAIVSQMAWTATFESAKAAKSIVSPAEIAVPSRPKNYSIV